MRLGCCDAGTAERDDLTHGHEPPPPAPAVELGLRVRRRGPARRARRAGMGVPRL